MNIHCSKSLDYTLALCLPLLMCKPANDRVIKNERAGNIFGGNQTEKLNIENTLTELDLSGWWYSVDSKCCG